MAEEFAFDQRFRQSRAVDGDKRALAPRTQTVKRAGHQFLPDAALASDQDTGLAWPGLLNQGENLLHFGGCAYQIAKLPFISRSEEHTSELQSLRHLVCR